MSGPFPWGWLAYLWCRLFHQLKGPFPVRGGGLFRCSTCWKSHHFSAKEPTHD